MAAVSRALGTVCCAVSTIFSGSLVLASSKPVDRNCGDVQDIFLGVNASAQFSDLPAHSASCTISAKMSTSGNLCSKRFGKDLALCFGNSCHEAGDANPRIIGWQKPAGQTILTATNPHRSLCRVRVRNFAYCCRSAEVSKAESPEVWGSLALASSKPFDQNCGQAQNFFLSIAASAQFSDLPAPSASCTISANTSTKGALCLSPFGQDLALCFGKTCHGTGDTNPRIEGWQKPAGQTALTVTNLHKSLCSLWVQNFAYCCRPAKVSKVELPDIDGSDADIAEDNVLV
eukprot:CAMPEP_0115666926 /NCGR_PEP_ID=MMETSP0272-20121206/49668_1 /TAXON_ID=71861 /ORGANISM="Scrippsiella trochoidea, Strain CCMP3099" /LENGTH=287 /DNA_ID=CAMNT_0003105441 /DNA_START=1 /DNA_END=864 /DNA_ORIENTATION=-